MRHLCRTAILSAIALLSIQPATLSFARTSAAAVPPAAAQNHPRIKKKSKNRHKNRKEKILKGRHGKHNSKPA